VEFSVVYTDKALSHMSDYFGDVMRDLSRVIKKAYNANTVALIPGSGSYAMEAVARQFGTDKDVMVLRNGYFSFRWSHIFDACNIPKSVNILKAQRQDDSAQPQFNTTPIEEVVAAIHDTKPEVVFMPHIETSTSIHLPDTYIRQVADAVHAHGGLLVLDGIAAGFNWADMEKVGADVMINAPQKSWSAVASVGMVMMSPNGRAALDNTTSTSMALDLKQWVNMMETYENGGMVSGRSPSITLTP
jgi:aspartate aminotransferase-like enzyme